MKKVLQKVLDELNKPEPRLDYIKGMLEVLIGEEEPTHILSGSNTIALSGKSIENVMKEVSESSPIRSLETGVKSRIEEIKRMTNG